MRPLELHERGPLFAIRAQVKTRRITLCNALGKRVATVYESALPAGGQQTARGDASVLTSETYFLRLQAEDKTAIRRVMVVW